MIKAEIRDGKLVLPNTIVTLTHNPAAVRSVNGTREHDGSFMYSLTSQSWGLPRYTTGEYVDIFEDEEVGVMQQMEELLDMKLNARHKNCSLLDYIYSIQKTDLDLNKLKKTLDLRKPEDYLKYLFLKVQPNITFDGTPESELAHYQWLLVEETEKVNKEAEKIEKQNSAIVWIEKHKNNAPMLYSVLTLCGEKIPYTLSVTELYKKVNDYIRLSKATLSKFVDMINDIRLKEKMFIERARRAKFLDYSNGSWYDVKNNQRIAGTLEELLTWLMSDEGIKIVESWKPLIQGYLAEHNMRY